MKRYQHNSNSLEEAVGVDIQELLERAEKLNRLAYNTFNTLSEFIEAYEKVFSKRELATLFVLSTMKNYQNYSENQNIMYG